MKKASLLLLILSVFFNVVAQDLTISFQPKVSGTPIDSIRVTNLRTNQSVKLMGNETLLLVKPTGINPLIDNSQAGYVFPNPTDKEASLSFSTNRSQDVEVRLFNVTGQLLNQQKQSLTLGLNRYQLKFPIAGVYYVSVNKSEGNESFKVVYSGKETQSSSIEYSGSENFEVPRADVNSLKSAMEGKTLTYKDGDVIQYSFSSGKNTTIVADIPKSSKALDIEFVECIDQDNRSYKVVKIGNQWWMAENLAYLPSVSPPTDRSDFSPFYYVNGYVGTDVPTAKTTVNYATYGVLYNWPAAMNGSTASDTIPSGVQGVCPKGWHLPSDAEWKQLEVTLGVLKTECDNEGGRGTNQGSLLKTSYGWIGWDANQESNGNNATGFSALPGGFISFDSMEPGQLGFWWSTSKYRDSGIDPWYRALSGSPNNITRSGFHPSYGLSVRGIKD